MKICKGCNVRYTDDINYCSLCGNKLEKYNSIGHKNTTDVLRYALGSIIIAVNLIRIRDIGIIAVLGIVFGLSFFPIIYDIYEKNLKLKLSRKNKKLVAVSFTIILGIVWLIIIPGEKLKYIRITNLEDVIAINESRKIELKTNLMNLNGQKFKYESSNEQIATVDSDGKIIGVSEGSATIAITGENNINVQKEVNVKYIDVDNLIIIGDVVIEVGTSGKLRYTTEPRVFSDRIVEWKSSNPEIITVNDVGEIKALSQGKSVISVITEKSKKFDVEVKSYIKIEALVISSENLKIEKTKTAQLKVEFIPSNADNFGITWSSSNDNVATVNENGMVTAVGEGNAIITALSANGIVVSSNIEVYEIKIESIVLNKKSLSLKNGTTAKVTTTISPKNASDKSIIWSSSNEHIASVKNGVITAHKRGTAIITAKTSNGKTATTLVTVTEKSPITIKRFRYTSDYVCGIEWTFSLVNNTNKSIKYVTLKWYNFNGVGDYVYDQIDGKNYTTLRYTGPLKPWANSGLRRNTTKFYSCNYKYSTFSEIKIDYTDGTSTTIKNSEFNLYTELTG